MERKKILIVENEMIESASMSLTLGRKGYDCSIATSGEKAIEMLQSSEPDLVLMDIGLDGKIDGISTAGIIRRQSGTPVIFITEQNNDEIFQQAKAAYPQNYLSKPFTDASLIQAVELALSHPMEPAVTGLPMPLGERVSDGIFVYSGNEYKKVLFSDILYLQAQGMFTIMQCTAGRCYKISLSSNNVVSQLAVPAIIKASRSYYVNIQRIDVIKNDELIVGNKPVPMSKNYKTDILSRVKKISQK